MAGTSSAHIKNFKETAHDKESHAHFAKGSPHTDILTKKEGRKGNSFELMQETLRYEKYSKYWSIMSNIAAIVSVTGAVLSLLKKRRWL